VSIPAVFLIGPGATLTPPSVSVPSGVSIALAVADHDGRAHTVVLAAPTRHVLHVPAGRSIGGLISGLPDGAYRLLVDGVARGRIVVGAQGGP
jgi:hypothetical protein